MKKTPLFVLLCFVLCVFSQMPTPVHAATWWDADWYYKIKLTVDQTKVDADLTDFPVLVYLNSSRINWALVQDDLDDLRFVNSTENGLLSAELEKSVTNSEAWIWVKVPAVSGSVDTVIYVYYGNVGAASAWDAENVWDASAVMVQHMKSNTNTTILDSTVNNNDGTLSSTGTFGVSTSSPTYTTVPANRMYGCSLVSPSDANGIITEIRWYGRTSSGIGNAKAVLVDNSLNIIAVSNSVATTATGAERINIFSSPPTITANTIYYLMMIFDVSTRLNYESGITNQGVLDITNNYTSPISPTDITNNNNQYKIKAVYTSTLFQTGDGEIDSALTFDGLNDYVNTPLNVDGYSSITMEAWVNPGDLSGGTLTNKAIISSPSETTLKSHLFVNKDSYLAGFQASTTTNIAATYPVALTQGLWYHIVGTYDGINVRVYVNGILGGYPAQTGTLVASSGVTKIGWGESTRWWKGIIDEARVYDSAKSAAWIKASYNSGADTLLTYGTSTSMTRLTIYYNIGINKLYINGTLTANNTILDPTPYKNVNATATVKPRYVFFKHILGAAPTFTTPYTFNMTQNYTLWTYAVVSEVSGASSGALIFTALLALIILIPVIWRRRR